MKTALVVPRLGADPAANLASLLALSNQAASNGATLILLPEACLTGLVNNDDPAHDLPLGQPIPGQVTSLFAQLCRAKSVWLGLGLLERVADSLYDTALLFSPTGEIALQYRRSQPQWHGRNADPAVYRQGKVLSCVETPFGRLAFLVCGDLFDDPIVSRLKALEPDLLLYPLARSLPGGVIDQQRWDALELPEYYQHIRLAGTATLMVNYVADESLTGDGSLGGAWVIAAGGTVLASLGVGRQDIQYYTI